MSLIKGLTISQARKGLLEKKFSAKELVESFVIEIKNSKKLNSYISFNFDSAIEKAKESDEKIAKGNARPLEGIPIAIKDLFCTKGIRTTAASNMLNNFIPPYESTVTQKLLNSGSIFLGKTNLDEFAMGSSNETSFFGPSINPWKPSNEKLDYVPGGSSGGSAVAVSANLCLGAVGTDTGGSIRQPASFCGIVGLKPTYGRCSRWGIVAFASSLDQAGPMTRNVEDAALLLYNMVGYDPKDSTSVNKEVPNFKDSIRRNIKNLKFGIPREYNLDESSPDVKNLWEKGINWIKQGGGEIVDISLPHTKYALPSYYIIAPAEASSNLSRYDGVRYGHRVEGGSLEELYQNTRGDGFGNEVKRRILIGTYVLSAGYYDAYYIKAQKIRSLIYNDFENVFKDVDVIFTPTTPNSAFPINAKIDDPISMYMNDLLTVPANMAGLPAISIPSGKDNKGLPLGFQFIGKPFDESGLLNIASYFEEVCEFEDDKEEWWKQ
ncbi:MAG: Asp-tRNA(Asn)/Glu-tRNA(Gln) amidotransferase GatCAB subunit A [Rhodospirillaceae bacterium]|nr:Asp-tRNA(Asn)/Glu-tRNA(Gln) amidotransferase GatCAB subunit A [Rhodospirillaceae bacterium]|tara:strand:+ start:55 stop:1533 length:1479 start_codon:yes stop_codon:yes gene_type:complete